MRRRGKTRRGRDGALVLILFCAMLPAAARADTTWQSGDWSTGSWTAGEPDLEDVATFPSAGGTITLSAGEQAKSLDFDGTFTFNSGDLTLSVGGVDVAATKTATINSTLKGVNGLSKTGAGTLTLGGANLLTGGITLSAGTLGANSATALGNNALTLSSGTLNLTLQAKQLRARDRRWRHALDYLRQNHLSQFAQRHYVLGP